MIAPVRRTSIADMQRRRDLLLISVMSLRDEFDVESSEFNAINLFVDTLIAGK